MWLVFIIACFVSGLIFFMLAVGGSYFYNWVNNQMKRDNYELEREIKEREEGEKDYV